MRKLSVLAIATIMAFPICPSASWAETSAPSAPPLLRQIAQTDESIYFRTRAKNLARQAAERANGGLTVYRAEPSMSGPSQSAPVVVNPNGSLTFTFQGGPPGYTVATLETVATVWSNGAVTLDYNGPVRGTSIGGAQLPREHVPSQSASVWSTEIGGAIPIPVPRDLPSQPTLTPPGSLPGASLPSPSVDPNPTAVTILPLEQSTAIPPLASPTSIPSALPTSVGQPLTAPAQPPQPPSTLAAQTQVPPSNNNAGLDADLFLTRAKNLARQSAIQANGGLGQYRPDPLMFGPAPQSPHVKNGDGSITFTFTGGTPGYQVPSVESVITVMPSNAVTINYNGPIRP